MSMRPRRPRRSSVTQDMIQSVFDLSPAEKLQLVQDLWDDLAATAEPGDISDELMEELERRKANLAKHPETGRTWEQVKKRVRESYGR